MTLVKTGTLNNGGDGVADAGDTISYSFTVTNTGNITLTDVTLNDPQVMVVGGPIASLAPGASDSVTFTASYVLTQADINAGAFTNTATASSAEGASDSDSDTQNFALLPALSLVKSVASGAPYDVVGDVIAYQFVVTNTGNVSLAGPVTINDDLTADESCPALGTVGNGDGALDPGESIVCSASYTVTQADIDVGSVANTASASAGGTTSNDSSAVANAIQQPGLDTVKALASNADGDGSGDVSLGDVLTYTVTVTNTGNRTLTNVTVTDNLISPNSTSCASLAPGATCVLTGTYTVTQADVDAGGISNTGTGDSDQTGPDSDTLNLPTGQSPGLSTVKALTGNADGDGSGDISLGDVLTYTVSVTNSGNQTLTDVTVTDTRITPSSTSCASVPPASTCVLTGTYTVTQADVDAGSIVNTGAGSAVSPPLGPDEDTVTTPVPRNPLITLVKTIDAGSPYASVGDVIDYTLTATNAGNVTLSNVVISDPLASIGSCTPAQPTALAPGATLVCNASYTVTQADLDAGSFVNTASVDALDPDGGAVADSDSATASGARTADLDVVKVIDSGNPFAAVGDELVYTITATNTGNVTLSGVTISDPQAVVGSCTPAQPATLAPGASISCPASYSVTQADLDAGSFTNIATGTGSEPSGTPVTDIGSATATANQNGLIDLVKTIDAGSPYANVGDVIEYTLTATNTGNVTLTNALISDPGATIGSCTPAQPVALAPGATLVCAASYTVTQAELDAGVFTNTATVSAQDPGANPVSDTSSATANAAQSPALDLSKVITSGDPYANVGDGILYTITATNTGNVTLDNVSISDPGATLGSCSPVQPASLAPGQTLTCGASYSIVQADVDAGSFSNTATVEGDDPDGNPVSAADTAVATAVQTLALSLVKTASLNDDNGNTFADAGEVIDYTITSVNTGNVTLADVEITDPLIGALSCTPAQPATLAPTEQLVCTGSYTVTAVDVAAGGFVVNTATVIAPDPFDPINNPPIENTTSTSTPVVPVPSLDLVKLASLNDTDGNGFADIGETIDYTLTATNDGNITLTDVEIVDPLIGALSCTPAQPAALAPTEQLACTGTYTVSQADLDNGPGIVNVATVAAPDPVDPINNPPVGDSDTETVPTAFDPRIELTKLITGGDPYASVGDTITYDLTATNTGNVTLDDVVISDPQATVGACAPAQPASLAPGETLVCAASYAVTQADLDAGSFTNTASVDGEDPNGDPVDDSDFAVANATQNPALFLDKALIANADEDASGNVTLGDTLTYGLVATNTGNVTLSNVTIADPMLGVPTCAPVQPAVLPPGAQLTCSGTYVVQQGDVDAGSIVNTGTADSDQVGPVQDVETVAVFGPEVVASKSSNPAPGSEVVAGQTISYTLNVTVADAPLTAPLVLSDTLGAGLSFAAVTVPGGFTADTAGNPLTFALPAGTPAGAYAVTYTATVDADATGSVGNSVVPTGGGDPDPECPSCDTDHPVADPAIVVTKAATPGSGSEVTAGQVISYTLTATVADAALSAPLVLTDTLGAGLTFASVTAAGAFAPDTTGNPLTFTLPTGTVPGTYAVTYTATVDADATGTVGNSVVPTGGGDPDPECPSCDTDHPVADPVIVVTKAATPGSGSEVTAGQVISYTLTATVSDAALSAPLVLTDTLGAGLTFGSVTAPGAFTPDTTGNPLTFTLPAGTVPGIYAVTYTATVDADATGSVGNSVVPAGGGDPDPECPSCDTDHPVADPVIVVTKAAAPGSGSEVFAGQQIVYTLTATVADAATTAPLVLADTLDADLVFGAVTANPGGFTPDTTGNPLTFTLASGAVPGSYTVTYTATVAATATGSVGNVVVPTGGGDPDPECPSCDTDHPVGELGLELTKSASLNDSNGNGLADVGEVIGYTLTATNTSTVALPGTTISDPMIPALTCTPPQPATLNPGDQLVCSGSYTVQQSDIDANTDIVNTATTEAPDPVTPGNPPLTDTDAANVGICTLDSGDVTGQLWHDLDRDNVIDPGEPALTSFVTLGPPGATPADLLVTTADPVTGVYSFPEVPEGIYEVRVLEAFLGNNFGLYAIQPPVRTITVVRCGTAVEDFNFGPTLDGVVGDFVWFDVNEDQVVDEFRDGDGNGVLTQNPLGTPISAVDFEWVDLNQNGNPDDGEFRRCGLAGVEVQLFDGSGSLVGTRLTNLRGEYFFSGLPLGDDYTAVVDDTNPANLASAQQFAADGNCLVLTPRAPASPPTPRGGLVAGCGATTPLTDQSPTLTAAEPIDESLDFGLVCGVAGQLQLTKVLAANADEDGSMTVTTGDTLTYTVTATNVGSVALSNVIVTDTRITPSSVACPLLAQGAACVLTGTYSVTAADAQAGEILNMAGADSDQTDPVETQLIVPVLAPQVLVTKTSDPASGTVVTPSDTVTYTLTAAVSGAPLIDPLVLSDTLGAGLTFGTVTNPGAFTPNTGGTPLTFTLPAGTPAGSYEVEYTATVDADATGTVGNVVVPTGGGDPDPECPSCDTEHSVETLLLDKSVVALDATGPNTWRIDYELVVTNPGAVDSSYTLTDTLGFTTDGVEPGAAGLVSTVGGTLAPALTSGGFVPVIDVPIQVSAAGVPIAAGAEHRYRLSIPLGVVSGQLLNESCTGAPGNGLYNQAELTGPVARFDDACASIGDAGDVAIRLIKTVELGVDFNGNDFGDVGDVLFYTFEITNIGNQPLTDVQLIDLMVDDLQCMTRASDGQRLTVLPHDAILYAGFERGGLGSLSPSASIQCTASHELTATDVARRRVENTATALGTGPNGEVVNSVSTAVYTGFQ